MSVHMTDYISAQKAADLFGITAHTVRRLGRENVIKMHSENDVHTYSLNGLRDRYDKVSKGDEKTSQSTIIEPTPVILQSQENKERIGEYQDQISTLKEEIERLNIMISEKDKNYSQLLEKYDSRYTEYQSQVAGIQDSLNKSQILQLKQADQMTNMSKQLTDTNEQLANIIRPPKKKRLFGLF